MSKSRFANACMKGRYCDDPNHWTNHASKREKEKESARRLESFFTGVADAARAQMLTPILKTYIPNNSIIAPSLSEHILAELLGTDTTWVYFLLQFFTGQMKKGSLSLGSEEDGGAYLGQHLA